jgi:hypothetical protein
MALEKNGHQSDQHIRWVIAASASVVVGHAAMDAAIANYPDQRFTLRNGMLVIRQHPQEPKARFLSYDQARHYSRRVI